MGRWLKLLQNQQSRTLLFLQLTAFIIVGCSEAAPHLDSSQVTDPLGKQGICESCQKKIDEVTEENYLIVRGNRYIVCDEKCGADLKEWLAKQ